MKRTEIEPKCRETETNVKQKELDLKPETESIRKRGETEPIQTNSERYEKEPIQTDSETEEHTSLTQEFKQIKLDLKSNETSVQPTIIKKQKRVKQIKGQLNLKQMLQRTNSKVKQRTSPIKKQKKRTTKQM